MTGYEATKAIRGLNHPNALSVPIIAMSADAFSDDIQHCLECGMNAHIAKPIDVIELTRLLKKIFNLNLSIKARVRRHALYIYLQFPPFRF